MKKILLLCLLFAGAGYAQTTTGRTQAGSLKPGAPPPEQKPVERENTGANISGQINAYTPFLVASVVFHDSSGNYILEAGENAQVTVNLKNVGGKPATDCRIELVSSATYKDIKVVNPSPIPELDPNHSVTAHIYLKGTHGLKNGNATFVLRVLEKKGFDLDPQKVLVVPTLAFQPPKMVLVDYGVQDPNRTGKIHKRQVVTVTLRIQNRGAATSFGTKASVTLGPNVLPIQVDPVYDLGDMRPGDFKDVTATIVTNDRAKEVAINLDVTDETHDYDYKKTLALPFETQQKRVEEIVVPAGEGPQGPKIAEAPGLKVEILDNIPKAAKDKPNAFAVVIGNRDYTRAPKVDFALNDAAIMKRYLTTAMGYRPENIIYVENATQADLTRIFGNETNYKGQLYDYVRKGLSEVFVYYSGHGAPDTDSKEGFLVPVDCDPAHVALNGYSLKTFYANLDKVDQEKNLKHVTVVLDACFSGSSVGGTLLKNVSPIYMKVNKEAMLSKNATILTSASGDQVSGWYRDKQQSLFTYFFLKALQGAADYHHNKEITAKEIFDFTADEIQGVPYWSRRLNSKTQTPTFYGSDWVLYDGK